MATRHFDNASLGAVPEPLLPFNLLMSGYAAPLRLIRPQQPEAADGEEQWSGSEESGNIGRCIRWAFAIEGGAAVAIYAVWSLCHLIW
jgi:hypothetical protein